jgi:hypothetical protein
MNPTAINLADQSLSRRDARESSSTSRWAGAGRVSGPDRPDRRGLVSQPTLAERDRHGLRLGRDGFADRTIRTVF